jgi:glycosyltransferase involved in cell wall biosynthesis
MPEVSVIIPSFNHAPYIGDAVKSVLSQSHKDFELIVVDDGSTDDSLEVLAGFSDVRLKVLTQPNKGAHAAINRGVHASNGEFLAILNSDDLYHPLRLEKALDVLRADRQVGLVGSYIEIIDQGGKSLGIKHGYMDSAPWLLDDPERSFRAGNDLHQVLLTENYWSTTSNFVFSRSWFEAVGEFRPLRFTHDWDFALRMAKVTCMVLLPDVLMQYRVHATNTIREDRAAMIFEICWCLAMHLPGHLSDRAFADIYSAPMVDKLLHSIYTFGIERVLSLMLLQKLAENQPLALELLTRDHPVRSVYLEYIQAELARMQAINPVAQPSDKESLLQPLLRKLRRGIK